MCPFLSVAIADKNLSHTFYSLVILAVHWSQLFVYFVTFDTNELKTDLTLTLLTT